MCIEYSNVNAENTRYNLRITLLQGGERGAGYFSSPVQAYRLHLGLIRNPSLGISGTFILQQEKRHESKNFF